MDQTFKPEDYLNCVQASQLTPGRPASTVIWRWMTTGIKDRKSGTRVKLRYMSVGGKLLTTAAWLEDFFREQARARESVPDHPPTRTIRRQTPKRREQLRLV